MVSSGVGGWHNTWLSDGQGGGLSHGDLGWLANLLTLGDGDDGWLWAVGGVASHGNVGGDGGGVRVASGNGGSKSRSSSDGGELHYEEASDCGCSIKKEEKREMAK